MTVLNLKKVGSKVVLIIKSEQEMKTLASQIAKEFSEIKLILLNGPIGVGKTSFVKGYASALGIKQLVTSPSFIIKNQYPGLIHYDLYFAKKLKAKSFISILNEDLMISKHLIIEWGGKIPHHLLNDYLEIKFKYLSPTIRKLVIKRRK